MPRGKSNSKGGRASRGNNGSNLTQEDRSRGGSNSGGNFKNDPERASEAGSIGGSRSSRS